MMIIWGFVAIFLAVWATMIFEAKYDTNQFKENRTDKPISTIVRVSILSNISLIAYHLFWGDLLVNYLVTFGIHTFFWDNTINVFRWKVISNILNLSYNHKVAHGLPMKWIEKVWWSVRQFLDKFYYHGSGISTLTWNPKTWTWDGIWYRIPWWGELLFKSAFLLAGIMLYFNLY